MSYQPLNDIILIEPDADKTYAEQTGTSLIIPEAYKWGPSDPPKWGRILAFGPACRLDKTCWGTQTPEKTVLHVGDRVVYARYGWEKLTDGERVYHLVKESHILAVACA